MRNNFIHVSLDCLPAASVRDSALWGQGHLQTKRLMSCLSSHPQSFAQVPPDFVTRERDGDDGDPDQRPARLNADGGYKKRHASELYDAKGSGAMGSGGSKGGGGGGRPASIMPLPSTSSGGPREGGPGATGGRAPENH